MAPLASPIHQVSQMGQNWLHASSFVRQRLRVPNEALKGALANVERAANLKTFCGPSSQSRPPAKRRIRKAADKASRVLPKAMPAEAGHPAAVVRFTRKAPKKMAGQAFVPKIRHA